MEYHRKVRLQHAKKLVEEGKNDLTVSLGCGFKSTSGFRRAFLKEFGVSPGKNRGKTKIDRFIVRQEV